MKVLDTDRLSLHHFTEQDAAFVLALVNEPSWLQFIGDKNVHSLDDARAYLRNGPEQMYAQRGHGLFRVDLDGSPIGMCGLIKRDSLDDVDVGYAFLPAYWGRGFAEESVRAVLQWGRAQLALTRVVAICSPDNARSIHLLQKVGMHFDRQMATANDTVAVYAIDF